MGDRQSEDSVEWFGVIDMLSVEGVGVVEECAGVVGVKALELRRDAVVDDGDLVLDWGIVCGGSRRMGRMCRQLLCVGIKSARVGDNCNRGLLSMLSALLLQELSNTAAIAADVVSMLIKLLFACGLFVVVSGALAAIVGVLALVCACGLVVVVGDVLIVGVVADVDGEVVDFAVVCCTVAIMLDTSLLPWCSNQCSRAHACRCLSVRGRVPLVRLGFLRRGLYLE